MPVVMQPNGQTFSHERQPMQRLEYHCTSGRPEMLSGLWHQRQERGHCLKKTVDLIPGPSSVDSLWTWRMSPDSPPGSLNASYRIACVSRAMISFCSSLPTVVKYAL